MKQRYIRNAPAFSVDDMEVLQKSRVAIVGCGGLGGYIIEELARIGIGSLILIDHDVFIESNLNRQLLAVEKNLGASKVDAARFRVKDINKDVSVQTFRVQLTAENAQRLLAGCDVICDAVDNAKARLALQDACNALQIPLVHGAIGGWHAQISTVFPGDDTLNNIYASAGEMAPPSALSFVPAVAASIEVAEAVKVLLQRGQLLRNKLLIINLLDHTYDIVNISETPHAEETK